MLRIASIVEGHGECEAVPILVRRIAKTLDPSLAPVVHPVIRVPASKLVKQGEIERAVEPGRGFSAVGQTGEEEVSTFFEIGRAHV